MRPQAPPTSECSCCLELAACRLVPWQELLHDFRADAARAQLLFDHAPGSAAVALASSEVFGKALVVEQPGRLIAEQQLLDDGRRRSRFGDARTSRLGDA